MNKQQVQMNTWVKERPFLDELAHFHKLINDIVDPFQKEATSIEKLDFDVAKEDFQRGIPLLKCDHLQMPMVDHACEIVEALVGLTDFSELPEPLLQHVEKVKKVLQNDSQFSKSIILAIMNEDYEELRNFIETYELNEGVTWFIAWTALGQALKPYLPQISKWQKEQEWDKGYCPTCGSLPSMAQLVRGSKGRQRHLVCSCCKSKWIFKRIACPYCENEDQELLRIMEVDLEEDIRIDVCNSCNGYIKTYTNEGKESIALSDWASMHLDILIKKKGYVKMGTQLLDLS